ncbi:MAG: hypothetical protein IJW18_07075 [Lachnospiraceae bacterium]|nr:hypothetical protein [Lachnospiraceae bacterium]
MFYGEYKGVVSREAKGKLSKHDWSEDCMVFEDIDDMLSEIFKDTVRYIRNHYGQIILEAYNHCIEGEFKDIEIRYE